MSPVEDLHIAIQQGIQKIASHIDYDMLSEEIDIELNHVIKEFVLSHFQFTVNGFELTNKSTNDIQPLLKKVALSSYIDTLPLVDSVDIDSIDLPNDYLLHISFTATTGATFIVVPFGSTKQATVDSGNLLIPGTTNLGLNPGDKVTVRDDANTLTEYTIDSIFYGNVDHPTSTTIVLTSSVTQTGNLIVYHGYDGIKQKRDTIGGSLKSCKRIHQDKILRILEDPFNRPTVSDPIYTIGTDKLSVFTNGFACSDGILTYVKTPTTVSLTGDIDCDLHISAKETIIDLTIKRILSINERFGTQGKYQELQQ